PADAVAGAWLPSRAPGAVSHGGLLLLVPIPSRKALRVSLKCRRWILLAPSAPVGIDILLLREEELEEADAPVLAGLLNAEKHKIIRQALLAHQAIREPSIVRERLNCLLCGIVVPGHPVMIQEREQLALVPGEPRLVGSSHLGAVDSSLQVAKVPGNVDLVVLQVPLHQTVLVDRVHDRPQQAA